MAEQEEQEEQKERSGYSPSFKRPAQILRLRRKRARSDAGASGSAASPGQSASAPACLRPFTPGPLLLSRGGGGGGGGGVKRRNPFANIENTHAKKKRVSDDEEDKAEVVDRNTPERQTEAEAEEDAREDARGDTREDTREDARGDTRGDTGGSALALRLAQAERAQEHQEDRQEDRQKKKKSPSRSEDEEEEEGPVDSLLLKSPGPSAAPPPVCSEYPADWSLKTRLLFTSPLSLLWAEHPRAQEEALGLSQHCRAQHASLPLSIQDPRSSSELRSAFQQSLVYWQHPSVAWIPLFPRINAERSFTGRSAPWAQDTALQLSLMGEWSISLSSLYSLLKARLCPYFYLCSYQFTALFRAAGLGGSSCITAVLSPTTRGLREAMTKEGISFSLPLVEERRKSREQQGLEEEEQESSDLKGGQDDEDDEDELSWLKEMGVQDQVKRPDSLSVHLRKEGPAVCVDHKPESVVCVEGTHTFTLINFLINCKSLVASAGSQAGLPPTLLAPHAFRGAAMHTLKARSVNVQSRVGSGFQSISSLEVTGPILPSSLHAITNLLRSAQRGNFSAVLYTHTPTAVMNTHTGSSQQLSACGLPPSSLQQLQQPSVLGKTSLRQVAMSNHSYSWMSV
ncbi:protein downstream neighbor of son homolog isoform X2 [Genypterus blacodes]|uniref:protein downstream neighbor of son homolog isoform X2 n=1 Tax=Genypterus blacodes TaxID=154954 RepID=UPI003F776EA8